MKVACRPNTTTRGESTWQTALGDLDSYDCTSSINSPSDLKPLLKPVVPPKIAICKGGVLQRQTVHTLLEAKANVLQVACEWIHSQEVTNVKGGEGTSGHCIPSHPVCDTCYRVVLRAHTEVNQTRR